MKSMTGFGRSTSRDASGKSSNVSVTASGVELEISLKAVNGRFLDVRFHMPREYAGFESDFKTILSSFFARGTLDLYINRSRPAEAPEVTANTQLAKKWLDGFRALGQSLKLEGEPSLELIAKMPEVLKIEERSEVGSDERALARELLRQAAESCDSERLREGQALNAELMRLCADLENLAQEMEALKADASTELTKRYRDRLQKLGFAGTVDDQRIAQEIVMQVDRADISEELTRLREHIKAYRGLLSNTEPQGKKLDFYAQELLREVNTIGAKSHIARLTAIVVDAKTMVERIREQVQNVE